MLVIHNVQRPVCDDDAVAGAEALFYIFGVVKPLLDQHDRVSADLLCFCDQFHYKGNIAVGAVLHLGAVPGKAFGRVLRRHTECFSELILTERMGVSTLGGKIAALIVVAFTEPCRRRAIEPPVGGGCGKQSVITHCPAPPHPPQGSHTGRGPPRKAWLHHIS